MNPADLPSPEDDPSLREALKRCSPETYAAACAFRRHGRREDLRRLVHGVIERFVERDRRSLLARGDDTVRLREDLDFDSLTMMEAVMIAEEVLAISVSNEELTHLHTLADVHAFMWNKISHRSAQAGATPPIANLADKAQGTGSPSASDPPTDAPTHALGPSPRHRTVIG